MDGISFGSPPEVPELLIEHIVKPQGAFKIKNFGETFADNLLFNLALLGCFGLPIHKDWVAKCHRTYQSQDKAYFRNLIELNIRTDSRSANGYLEGTSKGKMPQRKIVGSL